MKRDAIEKLERQGCFAEDWSTVEISDDTDLRKIRNVYFRGPVSIGANAEIINVPGGLSNVRIGDNVRIVNVARIENSPNAKFGVGTEVAVLDETGGRPVKIYPGISAQIAALAARMPDYSKTTLLPMIEKHIAQLPDMPEIGDGAEIIDCGPIIDTRIWPGVKVEGAAWLRNGSVVNNQVLRVKGEESRVKGEEPSLAYVGQGVNAENFIIEDASVANGVILRNTYVGQGATLDKGFTSHDSLFFANCSMENGEACAVLAGPFTVSMHKSSLLIGCQTSFMNAGSGTNMSNHMYKHGPVHWGVLERGVKSSSNSYMMHGSKIGAFSLVMGDHKTHPDTSEFPFSYLFGDSKGRTTVVPGAMLKSYGLKRDAEKWPKRDRRLGRGLKLNDRITFNVFNPYTMGLVLKAIDSIRHLAASVEDATGKILHNGIILRSSSLEKARDLYTMSIFKYLLLRLGDDLNPADVCKRHIPFDWIDLGGQLITAPTLQAALKAGSIEELEGIFDKAHAEYDADELAWIGFHFKGWVNADHHFQHRAGQLDDLVEKDRIKGLNDIAYEEEMLGL